VSEPHDFDDALGDECGDGCELGLVMPFVSVTSKGGPHDDESYTAGWEMGALDAELAHARVVKNERLIHTANEAQADLIAMRYGYRAEITPTGTDGWSALLLRSTGVD
jgi:hypothetical protein